MADVQKLGAWVVTLVFDDGMMATQALVAPSMEMAVAMLAVEAGKKAKGMLVNMAVAEVPPEWLRFALRSIESGKVSGEVVSLVSDNLRPAATIERSQERAPCAQDSGIDQSGLRFGGPEDYTPTFCRRHPNIVIQAGICPVCERDSGSVLR